MQNVSAEYKKAMRLPIRNRGYITARIGIVSSKAQDNVVAEESNNDFAYFANNTALFKGEDASKLYATGEWDFSKVDGSMYFLPPENAGMNYYNNGLVTNSLLGAIYISFDGNIADIKGVTIDFGECYPTEFTITSDNGIKTYSNSQSIFVTEDTFDAVTFLQITPTKMLNGMGRLRILQMTCGISNTFSNKQVLGFTYKEFVSSISESLPSQDMTLTVDNQNLYYNPDNPQSAVAYLEQGQQMKVYFGYDLDGTGKVEWVPEMTAYLKSWNATDTQAKFTMVDVFDWKLTGTYYKGLYRPQGIDLYDLALDVLSDAGIKDEEYEVDPYLKDVVVFNPLPPVTHAEALQIIANAGRCTLSSDRQGHINISASFVPDARATDNGAEYDTVQNILSELVTDAYAMCSNDFSAVDGSMLFRPEDDEELSEYLGFVSKEVADKNGDFDSPPVITITLEAGYTCYGLPITFRSTAPQAFSIATYYQDKPVQKIDVEYPSLDYMYDGQLYKFDKMLIVFTKGYPLARITVDRIKLGDSTDYIISRSYNLTASPVAERQDKVKAISVQRKTYRNSDETKELLSEELTLDVGQTEHTAYLNNASYGFQVSVTEGDATVEILESSSYFVKMRFSVVSGNTTKIKYSLTGSEYIVDEQYLRTVHNDTGVEKKWSNPLISTLELAQALEEWLASYYLGDVEYQLNWNGDPRTDANDLFFLELKDREKTMIRAYQNELSFNGAWSGTMKARKVVV
jgi:hypothetical protein